MKSIWIVPVLAVLILGTLGLSYDALAYDVCSDDRCAHETMTRYGVEVYNANTGKDITAGQLELLEEGAGHEDVWDHLFAHQEILGIFEDLFEIGATITMGHFWDPDQRKFCLDPLCISPLSADYIDDYDPDRDIILDGAAKSIMDADDRDGWESAWQKTEMYWSMSLGEFVFNNLDGSCPDEGDFEGCGAYHYLGHVAHHFGDNTVPTHVHQSAHDPFSTGTDAFENWMSGKKFPPAGYLWKDDAEEAELKQKVGVYVPRSTGIDPLAAMTGDAEISSGLHSGTVDTQREKLYYLLYTENQIADYFASDRVDGDGSDFSSDGTGFDPEGWVQTDLNHLNSIVASEDLPNDWFDLFDNNTDCDFFGDTTCGNDDDGDLSQIREYSYLRGIRSIAGLMELYDQTVTEKTIISVEITKIHINDYTCNDIICFPGSDSFDEECDDNDIFGNEGCDAYAKVTINGNFVTNVGQITENVEAGDTIEPKWRFGTELESETGAIFINIEIVDQDSTLNEDDKIDISPLGGTALGLIVDVEKCIKNEPAAIQPFSVPCGSSIAIDAGTGYGGTAGATITFIVKAVTNSPPVAKTAAFILASETGDDLILDGTGSSDPEGGPLTYDWDFDGDGEFDDATGATPTFFNIGDDTFVDIALRVTDDIGATDVDSTPISVFNVKPTIVEITAIPNPQDEGSSIDFTARVTDPGSDDLFVSWDWDDTSSDSASYYLVDSDNPDEFPSTSVAPRDVTDEQTHTWSDSGEFTVEFCVWDDDMAREGFSAGFEKRCQDVPITINNLPPVADAGEQFLTGEGSNLMLDGTGSSDPGGGTLTYEWVFGNDGVFGGATGATPTLSIGDNTLVEFALRVTDEGGLTDVDSVVHFVFNVEPTIVEITAIPNPQDEGSSIDFTARVTDPGSDDLFVSWDWDDTSSDSASYYLVDSDNPDEFPSPSIDPRDVTDEQTHTWSDSGEFTVEFCVLDDDMAGNAGTTKICQNVPITINNVNPTADLDVTKNGPTFANAGEIIRYDIRVNNPSTQPARNVIVTDIIPIEIVSLSLVSASPICVETNGVIQCNIGEMPADSFFDIFVEIQLPSNESGQITNIASVASDNDPNDSNNSSPPVITDVSIPPPVCGPDEELVDGVCVPLPPVCGPDEELVDGVCVPLPPDPASIEHYLSYKVKQPKGDDKFEKFTVFLDDKYKSATYTVDKPDRLLNPVNKNGEGLTDTISHYVGYKIKEPKGDPKFEHIKGVSVIDQFGELTIDIKKPKLLLVPSLKDHDVIPVPLISFTVNHFKCYDAKESKGTDKFDKLTVTVNDPNFEITQEFEVKKPKMLCIPVHKTHDEITSEITNGDNNLTCYDAKKLKGADKFEKRNVFTNNQFGPEELKVEKQEELCVPSKFLP